MSADRDFVLSSLFLHIVSFNEIRFQTLNIADIFMNGARNLCQRSLFGKLKALRETRESWVVYDFGI